MKPSITRATDINALRDKITKEYVGNKFSNINMYEDYSINYIDPTGMKPTRNEANRVYYNSRLKKVRLININNQNNRYEKIYFKSGKRKGELKEVKLIQKKEWIAYIYDIPLEMFKYITDNGRFVVTQHKHHFSIEKRKSI